MIGAVPQSAAGFNAAANVAATNSNTPLGEICEACESRFRVEAHYDDPWRTPITLAPLLVEYTNGSVISEGGRTRALATYGLQDGQSIQSVRPELGSYNDRAPNAGAIQARLVPENLGDPAALERQIIADIEAFYRTMRTSMQPWWDEWNARGWTGMLGSFAGNIGSGLESWWEGEGDFWKAVGNMIASLPELARDAWDTLTAGAKALWNNRGKILQLFKDLAEGSVAAFETGFAAVASALQGIPGLEEIAGLLKDLVEQSAEWAGAMIELATQTRVLAVLGANVLGIFLLIPPNLITDMIGLGFGYLLPELFIALLLAIVAFFTAGTGGALLAARIATYTAKVSTALRSAGRAGRSLVRVFELIQAISGKIVDLIKALKGRIDEVAEGVTNRITRITRRTGRRVREPAELPCFNQPPNATRAEFLTQLAEQEAAINNSDLSELMRRRQLVRANGTGPLRDRAAQQIARDDWMENRIAELTDEHGVVEARRLAGIEASTLDATHVLDIVAGGNPSAISGLQSSSVNRSIGSQWTSRVGALDGALSSQAGQGAVKAHVRLIPC